MDATEWQIEAQSMPVFETDLSASRIPVVVVCGPGGAGKTTFINRMVAQAGEACAVVVNERGAAAPAADLVEAIEGEMVPHAIGCLCCVARSGLVDTLRKLYALQCRRSGAFSRVIIETAGDADPAPVMQTLLNNALVTQYYRLDSVVCVLHAATLAARLEAHPHGRKQVAVADRVVINQFPDTDPAGTAALRARLRGLNPAAPVLIDGDPGIAPARMFGAGYASPPGSVTLDGWLGTASFAGSDALEGDLHAFCVALDQPLDWESFHGWLNAGARVHGDAMYRVKGVVNVRDQSGPVLLQGVQHVFQPPVMLDAWPQHDDRRTRLVFVTRQLSRDDIERSLRNDLPVFERASVERRMRQDRARLDPSLPA
jgi:G3E family GTPase